MPEAKVVDALNQGPHLVFYTANRVPIFLIAGELAYTAIVAIKALAPGIVIIYNFRTPLVSVYINVAECSTGRRNPPGRPAKPVLFVPSPFSNHTAVLFILLPATSSPPK